MLVDKDHHGVLLKQNQKKTTKAQKTTTVLVEKDHHAVLLLTVHQAARPFSSALHPQPHTVTVYTDIYVVHSHAASPSSIMFRTAGVAGFSLARPGLCVLLRLPVCRLANRTVYDV